MTVVEGQGPLSFDAELGVWTLDGGGPGPAGVAWWHAHGVTWVVDAVDPLRLVRCEVDVASVRGDGWTAVLQLVATLLGADAHEQVAGSARRDPTVVRRSTGLPARQAAGWLAVALDELGPDPEPDSLAAAEALRLARLVGVDDVLTPRMAPSNAAMVLDEMAEEVVERLAQAGSTSALQLAALEALARSATAPEATTSPLTELSPIPGRPMVQRYDGSQVDVWCQGLPAGAVRRAEIGGNPRAWQDVTVAVGDRPTGPLHVLALATEAGDRVVGVYPLAPGPEAGTLVARCNLAAVGAKRVAVAVGELPAVSTLREDAEAYHWGREAARSARRGDARDANRMWHECAAWWRRAGRSDQARAATRFVGAAVPAGPFLRDDPTVRAVLEDEIATASGPADVASYGRYSRLARSAELLGFVDLAASCRLEAAQRAKDEGNLLVAAIAAAQAHRDLEKCGQAPAAAVAAALWRQVAGGEP